MKVFNETNSIWPGKVNFVDDNNVLVGYDMKQDCCEHADWYIIDEIDANGTRIKEETYSNLQPTELPGYNFDPDFCEQYNASHLDGGGIAVFKLVKRATHWNGMDQDSVKYLHLFNSHNGYYGHGFTMSVPTKGGTL